MTIDNNKNITSTPTQAADDKAVHANTPSEKEKRTIGEKIFNIGLYAGIINTGVILVSTALNYFSVYGGKKVGEKLVYGEAGEFISKRLGAVINLLHKCGIKSERTAKSFAIVGWSFIDGSLLLPIAKWIEQKKYPIIGWIDEKFGVSKKEEKEEKPVPPLSWKNILSSRLATFSIVFPTAFALDRWQWGNKITPKGEPATINRVLFMGTGEKIGEKIEQKFPSFAKRVEEHEFKGLLGLVAFEVFYSSLCTVGLYTFSRLFSGWRKKENEKPTATEPTHFAQDADSTEPATTSWAEKTKPSSASKLAAKENFVARVEEPSSSYATPAM